MPTMEEIMKIENAQERIAALREFMLQHKPDLTVYRVPLKTLEQFKQLAKDEFCDDYGMTLKWLMDNASTFAIIFGILNELEMRVSKLEGGEPKPRHIHTLGGKTITAPPKQT